MQEYGISTDRRTIYTEIETLQKFGLDVQQKKGKNPGYYVGARDFELPELKLLVDAVQSSKFITEKKSKELIAKLEKLCCKTDAAAGIIKHYRVDKMQHTEILETERKGEESFKNFDLAAFAKKTFGMYGGVDEEVALECRNELAGVVIDRFGHDVWLIPQGEDYFKTRVLVSVSPQFFGWVTGIGSGMKITGPERVKAAYKDYLQEVLENY